MTVKELLVTCAAAVATFGAAFLAKAATVDARWTGKGGDNKWGTAENWNGNTVPGLTSDNWRVHVEGKTCEIEVEAGKTYKTYWFRVADDAQVTLKGSGKLDNATWTYVTKGSSMTVDGPEVTMNKIIDSGESTINGEIHVKSGSLRKSTALTLGGTAQLFVEGGFFGSTSTGSDRGFTVTNSAEVVITGGEFASGVVYLRGNGDGTGGTIRVLGGQYSVYYSYSYANTIGEGATFDFKGGTIRWTPGSGQYTVMDYTGGSTSLKTSHKCFLPPKGAALIVPTSATAYPAVSFNMNGEFSVGGTIYATNATAQTSGCVKIGKSDVSLSGGGTIFANQLSLDPSADDATLDLDLTALNLGAGGIVSGTTKDESIRIPNGISFGAWADWTMNESGDSKHEGRKFVVKGPLAFDTSDALDATKGAHSISAKGLDVADITELNVKGGGSVTLDSRNCPEQLRRVAVAAGGTLAFEGDFGCVKTMDFGLGASSTLKLDISENGSVDVAASATLGEGAKIVVTKIPATLTTGKQYPIFNLPPRKGDPISRPVVELPDGVPDGWDVRWIANCCYLGEATTVAGTYATEKSWTGKGADNLYSNTENWLNGKVGTGTSIIYFHGTSNTVINVDTAEHTCRYFRMLERCGAYVFRGNVLKFRYPYENVPDVPSVQLDGDWPVVIENDIVNYYQRVDDVVKYATHFRFWSHGEGSISVLGDSKKTLPLGYRGDVRLGGAWTTTDLQPSVTSGGRRTGLTILPGGVLTVEGQTTAQDREQYFAVAAGGAMTVSGTEFVFTNKVNTHFVDGTLTVNCPLVVATNQVFRGAGTLALKGGVSAPDGVTSGLKLEGEDLTLVPGGKWSADVPLTVRGTVTLAPTESWTLAAPLDLDDHATLTVAGPRVQLDAPLVSAGEVVVDGGKLVLGATGTKLWKVSCANDGCVEIADDVLAAGGFVDILSVRCDDSDLTFPDGLKIRKRYDLASDATVYSAKAKRGMLMIFR